MDHINYYGSLIQSINRSINESINKNNHSINLSVFLLITQMQQINEARQNKIFTKTFLKNS